MYRRLKTILAILVLMLPISVARGADIDLFLTVEQLPNGTAEWALSAAARSDADNDGIAGFNIDLVGIAQANHTSPLVASNPQFVSPIAGFTIGGVGFSNDGTVFAAQNQFVSGSQIYGVGEPGSTPPFIGPSFFARNIPWDQPVTLAVGTAASLLGPSFGQSINMTVWSQGQAAIGGVGAEFANVFPTIDRIPFGVNEWIAPGSGFWNTATNWSAGVVPNRFNARVGFGDTISAPATVTVDSSVTVERMEFNSAVPYTIASPGTPSVTLAGAAAVHVATGSHTISAPIVGASGLNKTGPGTLTLAGANTYTGDTNVSAGSLIVQNQVLPGENINVAAGATLTPRQFVNYQLQPNQTLTGSGNVVLEHTFSNSDLIVSPTSSVRGTLSIGADNVINSGLVAPGFSPGIIRIDGDYTQENDGALEIEVGGLAPGTQHDQLQVAGSASLGGRIEIPLINGFVPTAGSEIQFLTAESIDGVFDAVVSPNLASVAPLLAIDVVEFQGRVRFVPVAPATGPGSIQFIATAVVTPWIGQGTWTNDTTPGTVHPIRITNQIPSGEEQRVVVSGASAFTHQLMVEGGAGPITVDVNGVSLSATTDVTVKDQGAIQLNDANLVSSIANVIEGGRLLGNGMVVGNLVVGGPPGTQEAILSPSRLHEDGNIIGHIAVVGNYLQRVGGKMVLDVLGKENGQFDTIDFSGEAQLGGVLQVVVAEGAQVQEGDTLEILTAGSLTPDAVFERIETIGVSDLYFAIDYPNIGAASGQSEQDGVSATGSFRRHGDLDRDGAVNQNDVPLFALGLRNREGFFSARPRGFCLCIEADEAADMDDNGLLDFDDIDNFAMILQMNGMANALGAIQSALLEVPESNTLWMALVAMLAGHGFSGRKYRP